jgi:hypothetical protein
MGARASGERVEAEAVATGNLRDVQQLAGHASLSTTGESEGDFVVEGVFVLRRLRCGRWRCDTLPLLRGLDGFALVLVLGVGEHPDDL